MFFLNFFFCKHKTAYEMRISNWSSDVCSSDRDEELPLTPGEWPEWGNPVTDKAAFDYMLSYRPYDNVTAQAYPPMLVSAGLNDPRVTYWEDRKSTRLNSSH